MFEGEEQTMFEGEEQTMFEGEVELSKMLKIPNRLTIENFNG